MYPEGKENQDGMEQMPYLTSSEDRRTAELVRIRTLDWAASLPFGQTDSSALWPQPVIFTMLLKLRASYELLGHTEGHVDGHSARQPITSDVRVYG